MKKIALLFLMLCLGMTVTAEAKFKIGIITPTTSQSEDEFRAAEQIVAKYPGQVVHMTNPDNFSQEQETIISNVVSMASDPDIKVIILAQAFGGSTAGIKKALRNRSDITFMVFVPHEDPEVINEVADVIVDFDNVNRGRTLPELAKKLGAKKLVHYSFPRHMSYKLLADRRDMMMAECKKVGIEFIFVTMPDPATEGTPALQQFLLEDVGRQVKALGKDTAFFTTNDAAAEPIIKRVAELGAIFLEPDLPSPTMGYPGALGLKIPSAQSGDFNFINSEISKAIAKLGNTGRMANWPIPGGIVTLKAMADLAFETNGDKAKLQDQNLLAAQMSKVAGVEVKLSTYDSMKNFNLLMLSNIIY